MKRILNQVLYCLCAAALVASCGSSDTEGSTEQIAFVTTRGGNSEIYSMTLPAGTDAGSGVQTNLTQNPAEDLYPAWSPDGQHIAFTSERDGGQDIYIMDADGANVVKVTEGRADNWYPVWSPSGKRIAFMSQDGTSIDIMVMNPDGSGLGNLTDNPQGTDMWPVWAPDGKHLAFDFTSQVHVIKSTGAARTQLTQGQDSAFNVFPVWAPDGAPGGDRILFISSREGNWEVYSMRPDGSDQVNLSNNPADEGSPAYSPDGERIAFTSTRDGNMEIYVMRNDGTGVTRLTNNQVDDGLPTWSPDGAPGGDRIVFVSERDGGVNLFTMDADGGNEVQLTEGPGENHNPVWSP